MSQRSKILTSLVYKPDSVWPNRKRLSIYEQDSCALSLFESELLSKTLG